MKTVYLILLLVIFWEKTTAQKIDLSHRINIDKEVPPIPRMPALNAKEGYVDLSGLDEKVILLDFFDTFCSNCIASLPKLQQLQEKLPDKLQIVLVSWQDSITLARFWKNNPIVLANNVSLPVVYSDSLLRRYFPHQGIPHVAWLYQRKLQAVTHSDFVQEVNVLQLYREKNIRLPLKNDFAVNAIDSIFDNTTKGAVTVSGYRDGLSNESLAYAFDTVRRMYKTSFYNMSMLGAYSTVLSTIKEPNFYLKAGRIIWNVSDSSRFEYMGESGCGQRWLVDNAICYERFESKARDLKRQAEIVLQDLNQFLSLNVYWSTRKIKCLVIKGKMRPLKAGVKLNGQTIEGTGVLSFLMDYSGKYPPVLDLVQTKQKMIVPKYSDIRELNKHLAAYGLSVEEEMREMEVVVFDELP